MTQPTNSLRKAIIYIVCGALLAAAGVIIFVLFANNNIPHNPRIWRNVHYPIIMLVVGLGMVLNGVLDLTSYYKKKDKKNTTQSPSDDTNGDLDNQ